MEPRHGTAAYLPSWRTKLPIRRKLELSFYGRTDEGSCVKQYLATGFMLILLFGGTICLFRPREVQSIAQRIIPRGPTRRSEVLRTFIQSRAYTINLRAVGLLAYLIAVILLYALYTHKS